MLDFWDYPPTQIGEKWIQTGNIHDKKYGCWVRQLPNGVSMSINMGPRQRRIVKYWLRIGTCYHGRYDSPHLAAAAAEKILAKASAKKQPHIQ